MNHKKLLLLSTIVSAWAAMGQSAQAQQAGPTATATQGLQEIVITAERRSQNLQKAAIAVSAVTGDELADRSVTSATDLNKLVPSVNFATGGGGSNQVAIRGIGSVAGNGLAEQVVAFNMDGTYLARTGAVNGLYFDLDRIEVVKGPQGTLYGRNATAGAVNVITKKPTLDKFGGDVSINIGNYGLKQADAAVNVPLSDTFGLRFAAQSVDRRGFLSDGYNDEKHTSGRISALAKLSDNLTLNLTADYGHVGGKGGAGVVTPFVDASNPYLGPSDPKSQAAWNVFPFVQSPPQNTGYIDNDNSSLYGSLDWNTAIGKFTFIPSYRKSKTNSEHYAAGFKVNDVEDYDNNSMEARWASPEENALRGVLGLYYFDESGHFTLKSYPQDRVPPPANVTVSQVDDATTKATALFGQATYDVTKTFRLIAGARSSEEKKTFRGSVFGFPFNGDLKATKTTWKVGVETDLSPQSLLYATVGTGFKAGGFFVAANPNTFKPETITAWTIGSKNRFLDNRLQLNAEAFRWEYKDKQVSHLGPVAPYGFGLINLITENAGNATLYGVDMDSRFLLTDNDLIAANLQYEHSEYGSYVYSQTLLTGPILTSCKLGPSPLGPSFANVDCSGHVIARAPSWSLAMTYNHTMPLASGADVVFSISTTVKSNFWISDEQLPGQKQAGSGKIDLSVAYNAPDGNWSVTGYVNNATDKATLNAAFVDSLIQRSISVIDAPRTYGVRANLRF